MCVKSSLHDSTSNEYFYFFSSSTIAKSHYGFALPKGSLYTTDLSVQILRLSSQGVIKHLVNKWMVENTKCAALDELKQAEGIFTYICMTEVSW